MKINLFVICKNDRFFNLMEKLFNSENIFISGICKDLSQGSKDFKKSIPSPDIVLLDAYWPSGSCKKLLEEFLHAEIKVILTTNYKDEKLLDHFFPLQPQGHIFRTCDNYKMITDCIELVFLGKKCLQ